MSELTTVGRIECPRCKAVFDSDEHMMMHVEKRHPYYLEEVKEIRKTDEEVAEDKGVLQAFMSSMDAIMEELGVSYAPADYCEGGEYFFRGRWQCKVGSEIEMDYRIERMVSG